jgi:hypothetical protein
VPGLKVYGLGKDPSWGYGSSETYTYTATLPPDDILVENWATTDVTPGNHHVHLSNGSDMGTHTVEAGHITYVGLYPDWSPFVKYLSDGWQSKIYVRNNSGDFTAQVNTTYFVDQHTVVGDRVDYIHPNRTLTMIPPSMDYQSRASIVSSEDLSVLVQSSRNNNTEQTSYTGILPKNETGSFSWEEIGDTLYAPVIKRNRGGRSSSIQVFNTGVSTTTVYVDYYDDNGVALSGGSFEIGPYASTTFIPYASGNGGCNANDTVCSARIYTANPPQPLAGVVTEYDTSTGLVMTTHNLFHTGNYWLYFPIVALLF